MQLQGHVLNVSVRLRIFVKRVQQDCNGPVCLDFKDFPDRYVVRFADLLRKADPQRDEASIKSDEAALNAVFMKYEHDWPTLCDIMTGLRDGVPPGGHAGVAYGLNFENKRLKNIVLGPPMMNT